MFGQSYNDFNSSVYGNSRSSRRSNSSIYGSTNNNVRYQSSYTRNDGTFVTGHYQTMPNSTNHDNFTTRDNSNPRLPGPQEREPEIIHLMLITMAQVSKS
jgi:hypothetical protein